MPAGATEARVSAGFVVRCARCVLHAALSVCPLSATAVSSRSRALLELRRYFRFAPALDEHVRGAALVISHAGAPRRRLRSRRLR